jgi:type I restriction enzyme M protein
MAHKELRRMLVEEHKLDAVIKMPAGVFRPYAGVSTAIMVFTKTGVGGTDHVWFYDLKADGYSLDDKRTPLLPPEKLGPVPAELLSDKEHAKNNLPDVVMRWEEREGNERGNPRTAQSFCVPKADIAATGGYDLSLNRYKEVEHEDQQHDAAADIIRELRVLEKQISDGLTKLEAMLT